MKRKNMLTQIEIIIMLLVFAVSTAICLKAFAYSEHLSENNENRDNALLALQSSAELIKHSKGNLALCAEIFGGESGQECWVVDLEEGNKLTAVITENSNEYLGTAELSYFCSSGEVYELMIAWQEEAE